jgi:hypothetical protein
VVEVALTGRLGGEDSGEQVVKLLLLGAAERVEQTCSSCEPSALHACKRSPTAASQVQFDGAAASGSAQQLIGFQPVD